MAKQGKQYCAIDQWEEYEKVLAGLRGSAAYVSLVQTHGVDFSSPLFQLAEQTMQKQGSESVRRWPGTALAGQAVCHRYKCSPAFLSRLDSLIKGSDAAADSAERIKRILYHDDLQFYDLSHDLLLFTVARNGTMAVWDAFVK